MIAEAFEVNLIDDGATPGLDNFEKRIALARVQRAVGTACVALTKDWLNGLGTNKMGWPSTGFYVGASRGTSWERTANGVSILIDNARASGGMKQRYFGGTINMRDKLLAIPARSEFYGHSPTEFTNLQYVKFPSGTQAFVIGKGGVGRVDFDSGRELNVKGAGARSASLVAYWLKESVDQDADPTVIPPPEDYLETAKLAILIMLGKRGTGE